MLNLPDIVGHNPAEFSVAVGALQERLQADFLMSRRAPYRQIAALNAFVHALFLFVAGGLVRLFGGASPDSVDRELAEKYRHVPEMAVHKKIELKSFQAREYAGKGVDLGCGNGIIGGILMRHAGFSDLHGVDFNPQPEYAGSQGYSGYTAASLDSIPLPDASFDFAICVCVIEHVEKTDAALSEAARLLKPGKVFYFSTPSPAFRRSTLGYRLRALFGAKRAAERYACYKDLHAMQYIYRTPDEWASALRAAGFAHIEVKQIFSRRQLLIYDVLNYNVHHLRYCPTEILDRWYRRVPLLGRLAREMTAWLCAGVAAADATELNATHYFVAARKPS